MIDELALIFECGLNFLGHHRSLERGPIVEPQLGDAVE